jgi:coenzyme Q-binding protein COQ10
MPLFCLFFNPHQAYSSQVASMFFKEVVSKLVGSFSDRCFRIYGPAVPVLEKSYGQGR